MVENAHADCAVRAFRFAPLILILGIAAGCGGGGGGGGGNPAPAPAAPVVPTVSATISAAATIVNTAVTVSWSSTNATSCGIAELSATNLATTGSQQVTPSSAGQFTYTVQCTGAGGSATQAVVLNVPAPPTVTISVTPATEVLGANVTLTWSSTNASSCTGSDAWTGSRTLSGTLSVAAATPGTFNYTLKCDGAGGSATNTAALTARFGYSMTTQTLRPLPTPTAPSPALTGPLSKVRSWEYVIATTPAQPGLAQTIGASTADLVILNFCANNPAINRPVADPSGTKLIFGYIEMGEAFSCAYPQLFTNPLPSWFGNLNPGWAGLYTVRYWDPAWKAAVLLQVDRNMAAGFDGIFLDVLSADTQWAPGNIYNNPPYDDRVAAMATLLAEVRSYVNTKYPGKYLIGNNPENISLQNPAVLKNLDGIFQEAVYWVNSDSTTSHHVGTGYARHTSRDLAPRYGSANIPIFGNDYPTPLSDSSVVFPTFDFYSHLGWVPSVTKPHQDDAIFSTGPFMFTATATNSTATGRTGFVNYLSGGLAPNATLNGGDQGDFFIGGPGQNTIAGGAGNDTIYAHPAYAASKGKLIFNLNAGIKGTGPTPTVAISINGKSAVSATPITSPGGTSVQVFAVDVAPLASISSVVLTVTALFTDMNNYSNVEIESILCNGVAVDLATATYTDGGYVNGLSYSNRGSVTLPASSFFVTSPYLADTRDTIDGGGGTNTVIYRGPSANYTVAKQTNGSWLVTSAATAEGPDTLKNVQSLTFSDKSMILN
jgi:uncharacterized protein (TIGR01370 family)